MYEKCINLQMEPILNTKTYLKSCRLCLDDNTSVSLFSAYDSPMSPKLNYADIARQLLNNFQIMPNDQLPQSICNKCVEQLINFYQFRHECEESDQKLKSVLQTLTQIKNEPIDPLINNDEIEFGYNSETGDTIKDEIIISDPIQNDYNEKIENELKANSNYKCNKCHRIFKIYNYFKPHQNKCTGSKETKIIRKPAFTKKNSKNLNQENNFNEIPPLETLNTFVIDSNNDRNENPIDNTNTIKKMLKCEFCTEIFTTLKDFDDHLLYHNLQIRRNSHINDQELPDNQNHNIKEKYIKKESHSWSCNVCRQSFTKYAQLKSHKLIHSPRKSSNLFSCYLCCRQFKRQVNLEIHKSKTHRWTFPKTCECGQQFPNEQSFAKHECFAKTFQCFKCHQNLKSLQKLKRHIKHHRVQGGICDVCGKYFTDRRYLKTHMDYVHNGELDYNFECDICKKRFQTREKIRNHMIFHRPDQPYACDVCGKKFYQKSHVRAHAVIHSDIRKHECQLCHKTYRRMWDLTKHMNSHYKTKIFACRLCDKSYLQRTRVNRHLNINHQIFKDYSTYINAIKN